MPETMRTILVTIFFLIMFESTCLAHKLDGPVKFVHEFSAMGVRFRIVAFVAADAKPEQLAHAIEDRVEYLENVFSDYRNDSEVARLVKSTAPFNAAKVSSELYQVCKESARIHQWTGGAFDPTIGPVSKLWRFARKRNRIAEPERIHEAMKSVGWTNVVLADRQRIALKQPKMKFDFGGIAKGFAADEILQLLQRQSKQPALIDCGGDVRVGHAPADRDTWTISVGQKKNLLELALVNCGVATSGATEQSLLVSGTRYSHIIDPRSGHPVTHSWNVTVVAPNAALADALASAFSVLGKEKGMEIANSKSEVFALFLDVKSGAKFFSDGFEKLLKR